VSFVSTVDLWRLRATLLVHNQEETPKMNLKTLATAFALVALPGLAAAMCGSKSSLEQHAMTCAEGSVWDAATEACVPLTTS
jgi:hypothetical protein